MVWFLATSTKIMSNPLNGACCTLDLDGDLWWSCNVLLGKLDLWVHFHLWVTELKWELCLAPWRQEGLCGPIEGPSIDVGGDVWQQVCAGVRNVAEHNGEGFWLVCGRYVRRAATSPGETGRTYW